MVRIVFRSIFFVSLTPHALSRAVFRWLQLGFSVFLLYSVIMGCRKLVERANEWLYKNTEVQVRSCETITWMSHDAKRLGDGEYMVLTQNIEENGSTSCLRGFRYKQQKYPECFKTYTKQRRRVRPTVFILMCMCVRGPSVRVRIN